MTSPDHAAVEDAVEMLTEMLANETVAGLKANDKLKAVLGYLTSMTAERDAIRTRLAEAMDRLEVADLALQHGSDACAARIRERDAALARAECLQVELDGACDLQAESTAKWSALLQEALARAEKAIERNGELIALLAEFQGAAETKGHEPVWRVGRRHVLKQRDAALARVRALEEGLENAVSAFDRIAGEIDDDAGGADWSDEVRAEAVELRALLTPASPETTNGKDATNAL